MSGPDATPPPTASPGGGLEYCYRHPGRETGVHCIRCNRPICPECMHAASVGFQCPDDVKAGRIKQRTQLGATLRGGQPYVTLSIIALNVIIYVVTALGTGGNLNDPTQTRFFNDWTTVPVYIHDNDQYYRLLTGAFLHVSLIHIGLNMLALYIIGPSLERLLGPGRYIALYLLGALGGSVAVYTFGLAASAGASGAIFGLFAAALIFVRELGLDLRSVVMTIIVNFVFTFAVADISKLGHIGGFIAGGAAALAIGGLPQHRGKLTASMQGWLLSGVFLALLALVLIRSTTFPVVNY